MMEHGANLALDPERVQGRGYSSGTRYCAHQRAACTVRAGRPLRQRRAESISASVAPWLLAHISAAEAEYLAT